MMLVIMTDAGPVDVAYLDGYGFGDRMLEGVLFKIIILEGKINCPGVHEKHQRYADAFTLEQVAKWQIDAEKNCEQLGDNLQTEDGEDAWIEVVEADPQDPLAAVRENNDPASDYVDANALLGALGREPRGVVRSIEAESFDQISKRIMGTLTPIDKTG